MEIEAFLADTVQASGGKLHALGIGWRVIQAQTIPARHDRVGIGLIVRTEAAEAGPHTLTLSLLDPQGAALAFGAGGPLEATFSSPNGQGTATLALNLDGVVFEAEGDHLFVLAIDGRETARLPFHVQTAPEPPVSEFRTGVYL
jgi:Family of unknown function (DUF6941)